MSMRILVTGATGFVGRQVLKALAGADVHAVVRPGQEATLPQDVTPVRSPALFAETEDWWVKTLSGVDTVIHLAWIATPGEYLTSPVNLDCLAGTLAMARGAMRAGVGRFVGLGTCFEYRMTDTPLPADAPLDPQTPYADAKVATFRALQELFSGGGPSFAWCRLFYLFGEGEDPRRLVPVLHARLGAGEPVEMTSGEQLRDFIDVAKAGAMIADVARGDMAGPVNICSGNAISVRALAEGIADSYGRRDLLRFGARPDNLFDPPHVVGIPLQGGVYG